MTIPTRADLPAQRLLLLLGLVGTLVGAYVLMNPPLSLLVFLYTVAFQAVAAGVLLVALGWKIRQRITNEWNLYVTGTLSILFGLSLFVTPIAGSLSIVVFVAVWSIVTGAVRCASPSHSGSATCRRPRLLPDGPASVDRRDQACGSTGASERRRLQ